MRRQSEQGSREERELEFSGLLLLALWLGLAYGFLEGLLLLIICDFTYILLWRNGVTSRVLWTSPAINSGLFLVAGCGLGLVWALVGSRARRWVWPVSFALLVGVSIFGLMMAPLVIQAVGCAALAGGTGVQAFRWAKRHFAMAFFRRTLAALLVLVIIAGVIGELGQRWREHQFLASRPPPPKSAPNVLLIILDTLRADHLSSYGYPRHTTPNIDRLASEGALFEMAFSPSTCTPRSHLAMLSGKTLDGNWFYWTERDRFRPLISEAAARDGYATVACVANSFWCIPQIVLRPGFARYEVYFQSSADAFRRTFYGLVLSHLVRWGWYYDIPGRKRANVVNQELLQWIDETRPTGRPFFAMLNYLDVFYPYFAPAPLRTKFSLRVTRKNMLALYQHGRLRPKLSPADVHPLNDPYDGSLAYLDYEIGQLSEQLERRGLLDNTLVIITADHGEALGEMGQFGHVKPILRQEVTHVPLIIRYPPEVPAGVRAPYPVTLRDLPATITQAIGADDRIQFPVRSLVASLKDPRKPVLVEALPGHAVAYENWQLILWNGNVQLYNLDKDPKEMTNLAGRPETAPIEAYLWSQLAGMVKELAGSKQAEKFPLPPAD